MRTYIWLLAAGVGMGQEVAFVTKEAGGAARIQEGEGQARRRVTPCSTFKIANAVIGMETGAVAGPDHVMRYDEGKYPQTGFWVKAWGKDLDLREAFRISAVWYFREMAMAVGREKMQGFLDRVGYGNRDTSGWAAPFWLGSSLRISAVEQVEFLDRLFGNAHGGKAGTLRALETMMYQETEGGRSLFYKTGTCTDLEAGPVMWLAGYVEDRGNRTYFALNAAGGDVNGMTGRRVEMAKERLGRLGVWGR
jgi:beta-lactamase class D